MVKKKKREPVKTSPDKIQRLKDLGAKPEQIRRQKDIDAGIRTQQDVETSLTRKKQIEEGKSLFETAKRRGISGSIDTRTGVVSDARGLPVSGIENGKLVLKGSKEAVLAERGDPVEEGKFVTKELGEVPLTEEERAGLTEEEIAEFEREGEDIAGGAGEVTAGDIMTLGGIGGLGKGLVKQIGTGVGREAGEIAAKIAAKEERKIIATKLDDFAKAAKETKRLEKAQEGIDVYKLTPDQAETWADDVLKLSDKPTKLLSKLKKFVFSKKGFWTATAATGLFLGSVGYQWSAYWGAADNLSGTASQDSTVLMNTIKFGIKNEETGEKIFLTTEDIEKRKAEIMMKQNSAEATMRYAKWINPATGWPISKFYGAMAQGNRETIEFNFDLIDQMKGGKE